MSLLSVERAAFVGVFAGWLIGLGWKTVVFVGTLAWSTGWLLNSPIPQGYKNPWKLRAIMAAGKLFQLISRLLQTFYTKKDALLYLGRLGNDMFEAPDLPVEFKDSTIAGVKVRIYRPKGLPENDNPAVVYYHGGGWVLGNVDLLHPFCTTVAHEVQSVLVSVEYRLAPEHPFPAPLNDCVAVTQYLLEHPEEYGVDGSRVAVAGDSAGGNLAAATALKLRDMKVKQQPKLQVLIYPALQAIDINSPSYQVNEDHPFLARKDMALFWSLYATGEDHHADALLKNEHTSASAKAEFYENQLKHEIILAKYKDAKYVSNRPGFGDAELWETLKPVLTDPYFSPLMAKDLSGLPEALVVTMQDDVLRDDGIWYAESLKSAGISVTHHNYMAGFHGMLGMVSEQPNNIESRDLVYSFLKAKL